MLSCLCLAIAYVQKICEQRGRERKMWVWSNVGMSTLHDVTLQGAVKAHEQKMEELDSTNGATRASGIWDGSFRKNGSMRLSLNVCSVFEKLCLHSFFFFLKVRSHKRHAEPRWDISLCVTNAGSWQNWPVIEITRLFVRPSMLFLSLLPSQVVAGSNVGEQQLMLSVYGTANHFHLANGRMVLPISVFLFLSSRPDSLPGNDGGGCHAGWPCW